MMKREPRPLVAGIGLAAVAFGLAPVAAPRQFARLFGFPPPDPAARSVMRSLGVRDAVLGMGLWSAAAHGGNFLPWLLARALTDAGDAVSVGAAVGGGARNPRFVALGSLALAAALVEAALYAGVKRARTNEEW